ncbi:TPA: ferritin-like domain-containing protein, partial [Burkholderia cenocepacia]
MPARVRAAIAAPVSSPFDEFSARLWEPRVRRTTSPLPRRSNVKPVDPRVITLLNDALTIELTVVNSYFLNARMLDNWGLPRLGKVFYDLSIGEMKDADEL